MIRDCMFEYLLGTAIKVERATYCKIRTSRLNQCGDSENSKAVVDIGGGGTQAYVWTDRLFMENNHWTDILLRSSSGALWHRNSYHENIITEGVVRYVDGSASFVDIDGCFFWNCKPFAVVLGQPGTGIVAYGSSVRNSHFEGFSMLGAGPVLHVAGTAYHSTLSNLTFDGHFGSQFQTDRSIHIDANSCKVNDIAAWYGGGISCGGSYCEFADILLYRPYTPTGQYALDITGSDCALEGALIDGSFLNSTCHGVRAASGIVSGVQVIAVGGNGITATTAATILTGNHVSGISGTPYVYVNGIVARNNAGFVLTNTVTSGTGLSSTITQHAEAGSFLTDSITTGPGATHTITLTNQVLSAASVIHAKATLHDSSAGIPLIEKETRNNGSVVWVIRNIGAGAFNGTNPLRVDYIVQNF
jgi:hypothetical protein